MGSLQSAGISTHRPASDKMKSRSFKVEWMEMLYV